MKNKVYLPAILTILVFFFYGCKKEDPQIGNANVKSTTMTISSWTWNGSSGIQYDYASFTWTAITYDIVNSGGVFIYLRTGTDTWAPLPRTVFLNNTYTQSQRYIYSVNSFRVIVQDSDLTQPVNPGTWTIKVLAVASSLRRANPNLDWNNYEAVKARFHLKD